MQKAEIQSWISSGKDYGDGIRILRKHRPGSALMRMLEAGADPYNLKKLTQALLDIQTSLPDPTPVDNKEVSISEREYPKKLLRLRAERKTLYAEVNHLHSCSISYPEGDGLRDLSFEILSKWDRIDEIWTIEDYYNENETMPPDAADLLEEKNNDPIYLKQRQANLRSSISKIPGKMKKYSGDNKKVADLVKRKALYEMELQTVNDKLIKWTEKA